jgi:hypothetical protein
MNSSRDRDVLILVVLVCLGWGDAFATLIRQTTEYGTHEEEYGMGAWAANRKSGIRNYVYSANMTSNPSTFKTLDKPGYWVSCASVTETIRNR